MGSNASKIESKTTVCIIGSGAAGLAALKVFKDCPQVKSNLWSLIAFESRGDFGGIW